METSGGLPKVPNEEDGEIINVYHTVNSYKTDNGGLEVDAASSVVSGQSLLSGASARDQLNLQHDPSHSHDPVADGYGGTVTTGRPSNHYQVTNIAHSLGTARAIEMAQRQSVKSIASNSSSDDEDNIYKQVELMRAQISGLIIQQQEQELRMLQLSNNNNKKNGANNDDDGEYTTFQKISVLAIVTVLFLSIYSTVATTYLLHLNSQCSLCSSNSGLDDGINGGAALGERNSTNSDNPSLYPTALPTELPTEDPTTQPTEFLIPATTNAPTSATAAPSSAPTDTITETSSPTTSPVLNPTSIPTDQPIDTPTHSPTEDPSNEPTTQPTDSPSGTPTASPTDIATQPPTNEPSINPSNNPTDSPTNDPTKRPTFSPTSEPTPGPDTARLLDSIVVENGDDIDGEGIDFVFDESTWGFDYSRYQIVVFNVIPSNHDVPLYIRVSTDGGSTYDGGAMYEYNVNCITAELENEVDASGYSLVRTHQIAISCHTNDFMISSSTDVGFSGEVTIILPSDTSHKKTIYWMGSYGAASGVVLDKMASTQGSGIYVSTSAVNGLQMFFQGANMSSGVFQLWGLP